MLEQFSATVEKIYAASAGETPWAHALVAVENLTGSAGAVIDLVPTSEGIPRETLAGSFTEDNCAEYAGIYQAICPRIRFAMDHPGHGTQYDYLFMTETAMDRDPVYDWFGKHGLRYYVGSRVADAPNYLTYVSLQRTRRQGHVESGDVATFELLKPHLARAVSLADQLGPLREQRRLSCALLEALPNAVFALGAGGAVLFANSAAAELLGDGLSIEGGRLHVQAPNEQSALDAELRAALEMVEVRAGAWTRISRPSGRPPYAAFVTPLRSQDEHLLSTQAKILVIVHDPISVRAADPQMLISLYRLTDTEARLASAIGSAHSVESAAAFLNMQIATARSHLKSIFTKTGVHRQQDLVRLLTSLSSARR